MSAYVVRRWKEEEIERRGMERNGENVVLGGVYPVDLDHAY